MAGWLPACCAFRVNIRLCGRKRQEGRLRSAVSAPEEMADVDPGFWLLFFWRAYAGQKERPNPSGLTRAERSGPDVATCGRHVNWQGEKFCSFQVASNAPCKVSPLRLSLHSACCEAAGGCTSGSMDHGQLFVRQPHRGIQG